MDIEIWVNLENNTPICDYKKGTELLLSKRISKEFFILKYGGEGVSTNDVTLEFQALLTYQKQKCLIFSKQAIEKIRHYKSTMSLSIDEELLFTLVHSLNNELASWNAILKDKNSRDILLDLKHFNKDEKVFKDLVEQYKGRYVMGYNESYQDDFTSIMFTFNGSTPSITITNQLLISDIFDCLRKSYEFDILKGNNLLNAATRFKERKALQLFEFFNTPNPLLYFQVKSKVHEVIADLFSLSGEESSEDQIKKWIFRARKH